MNAKQNALRILRFDRPEWVMSGCPTHDIGYRGCNHEGYDGGGHHLPVGSVWQDIWGTEWQREHEGVMGFPRGNPLANPTADLAAYAWLDPDDDRIVRQLPAGSRWLRNMGMMACWSPASLLAALKGGFFAW